MAISKLGGTGSDNWELISSVTPTGGASNVNFTGLSPYKKLMLVWRSIVLAGSQNLKARLNNDSGSYYGIQYTSPSGGIGLYLANTEWVIGGSGATDHSGYLIVSSTDNSGVKILETGADQGATNYAYIEGYYLASAVVSQVNFYSTSTFTAAGTVSLYGVK